MASERSALLGAATPELSSNLQSSIEDSQERSRETQRKGLCGKILKVVRGPERLWSVIYASLVAVLGSLMFGYSLGYASPVLLELSNDNFTKNVSHASFSPTGVYTALFGAFVPLGAAIGGLTFGTVADYLGRRTAMMVCGIPFFVGFLLIALSRLTHGDAFYGLILTGRLVSGYGCGSASLVVPMYISEISPPGLRGLLGTLPQLAVVTGIGLVYGLGAIPVKFDSYKYLSYEFLAAVVCVIVVLYEVLLFTVKESPSWLIRKKYENAAAKSLKWFRGSRVTIHKEVDTLTKSIFQQKDVGTLQIFKLFRKRTVWKPLILTGFVMFFQQFSGVNAIIFYSGPIFKTAHVSNPALVSTGAVGAIQIAATLVCVLLTDLVGRRWLLMIGSVGMVVSTTTMGVYFYLVETYCGTGGGNGTANETIGGISQLLASNASNNNIICQPGFSALAITSVAVYMIVFSLGWGAIPWLLSAEMFPMLVRGKCMSIATFINWIFATIITAAYQKYADTVTSYGAFWSFSVVMVASLIFVIFFLPETKGKTLQEIEAKFAGKHVEDMVVENEGVNVVID